VAVVDNVVRRGAQDPGGNVECGSAIERDGLVSRTAWQAHVSAILGEHYRGAGSSRYFMRPWNPRDCNIRVAMKSQNQTRGRFRISDYISEQILAILRLVVDTTCIASVGIWRTLWLECDAFLEAPRSENDEEKNDRNRRDYC
jgi:hypothetical protein